MNVISAVVIVALLGVYLMTPTPIEEGKNKEVVKEYCSKFPQDVRCQVIRQAGL